jgi:hypothetical protein
MSLNCLTSRMHSQPPARGDRLRGVVALYQPSIFKHRRKRSAAAIGERIGPALTIVRDESPNRHGLHRMGGDADRAMGNAGRHAEQITRSCALSFVVALAMMGDFHGQALRNAAIAALRRRLYRAGVSYALVRAARFRWS